MRGWKISKVIREEDGVLPIALAGDIDAFLDEGVEGVAPAGMRAALFHPLTGYSLPDAAGLAERIADQDDLSGPALARFAVRHAASVWRNRSFYRLLSRMLFSAAAPDQRGRPSRRRSKSAISSELGIATTRLTSRTSGSPSGY